jgi:hypothetical protein
MARHQLSKEHQLIKEQCQLTKEQWIAKFIKENDEIWTHFTDEQCLQLYPLIDDTKAFLKLANKLTNDDDIFEIEYNDYQLSLLPQLPNSKKYNRKLISVGHMGRTYDCNRCLIFLGYSGYFGLTNISGPENCKWIIQVDTWYDNSDLYLFDNRCVQVLDLPSEFHISDLRKQLKTNRVYDSLICLK